MLYPIGFKNFTIESFISRKPYRFYPYFFSFKTFLINPSDQITYLRVKDTFSSLKYT